MIDDQHDNRADDGDHYAADIDPGDTRVAEVLEDLTPTSAPVLFREIKTPPNFEAIASELDIDPMDYRGMPIYRPRYNVAPTDDSPARSDAEV